jgi:cardiolipin synthase
MYRWVVSLIISLLVVLWFYTGSLQFSLGSGFSIPVAAQSDWSVDQLEKISWELWISPYGTEQKLLSLLGNTKDILYVQTYDFTHKKVRELLKKLVLGWTDVRIMQENKKYQQYADTYKQVVDFFAWNDNIQVKSDEELWTNFLHTKLKLTDTHYSIQTANLTQSAFKNREYFLVGNDPNIWKNLHDLFLKDWVWEEIYAVDIHPNLLVCPINCRKVLESIIMEAKESILIQTQYIVDEHIMDLLKKQSSLDMQIVVADLDSNRDMLYYFWPKVARALPKPYVHAKAMLIDDKYLYVGSINFSANSMDENRELGIIVTNREAIDAFTKQFVQDWGNSIGKWK